MLVIFFLIKFQNTSKLKEAFKDPNTLPALCHILGTSQNSQVFEISFLVFKIIFNIKEGIMVNLYRSDVIIDVFQ